MTIYFTKRFTSGTLKGISVVAHIEFPNEQVGYYAGKFCKGISGRDCITKDRWIITDASFQNYKRN